MHKKINLVRIYIKISKIVSFILSILCLIYFSATGTLESFFISILIILPLSLLIIYAVKYFLIQDLLTNNIKSLCEILDRTVLMKIASEELLIKILNREKITNFSLNATISHAHLPENLRDSIKFENNFIVINNSKYNLEEINYYEIIRLTGVGGHTGSTNLKMILNGKEHYEKLSDIIFGNEIAKFHEVIYSKLIEYSKSFKYPSKTIYNKLNDNFKYN